MHNLAAHTVDNLSCPINTYEEEIWSLTTTLSRFFIAPNVKHFPIGIVELSGVLKKVAKTHVTKSLHACRCQMGET